MKKPNTKLPTVLPGDHFHVKVPSRISRHMAPFALPAGPHRLLVEQISPIRREGERSYVVSEPITTRGRLHIKLTVCEAERFEGWVFLGNDKHPVPGAHEPSIVARSCGTINALNKLRPTRKD
jgi:hypothetical protein